MTSLFNSSWHVGAIVAAGVTYGTFQMSSTWACSFSPLSIFKSNGKSREGLVTNFFNTLGRLPSIFQLVPSLCQILTIPFCPESPR